MYIQNDYYFEGLNKSYYDHGYEFHDPKHSSQKSYVIEVPDSIRLIANFFKFTEFRSLIISNLILL